VILGRFYAQFCHTLSNLVNNGVPLLNSLKLITRGTPNLYIRNYLENVVLDVGEGTSLAKAMETTQAFPEALVDRIVIGNAGSDRHTHICSNDCGSHRLLHG